MDEYPLDMERIEKIYKEMRDEIPQSKVSDAHLMQLIYQGAYEHERKKANGEWVTLH